MLFRKLISHIGIILGGMLLTFYIIDLINPAMEFIDNDITKALIGIFAVVGIVLAILNLSALPLIRKQKQK